MIVGINKYHPDTIRKATYEIDMRIKDVDYIKKRESLQKWIDGGLLFKSCPEPEVNYVKKNRKDCIEALCQQIESNSMRMSVEAFFSIKAPLRPQGLPLLLQTISS